uniref:Arrestin-like N-terminal domain-containing protein n=1 Tax=Cynoglossus semilaevis TaxID=244447 RepID=A0A3P8W9I1_CYNSE
MMPSVDSFNISYDALNEEGTFSPGDIITGKVTLVLSKETKVKCLYIKAKGDADVCWSEERGDQNRTYSVYCMCFRPVLIGANPNDRIHNKGKCQEDMQNVFIYFLFIFW